MLPEGNYTLNDTIVITKPVTIIGTGFATQLYMKNNKTMFQFVNVNNSAIRDVYLGSASTTGHLIEFIGGGHNQINNVTMLGGNYGLHLYGSLLNTIIDLRSGTNFQGFFAPTSINNTWVMAERNPTTNISSNANTFIAPVLEGGKNGIVINDGNGQGSLQIMGGSIEGVSATGLTIQNTFLPSSITGVHFEANGQDINIQNASNIRMTAILSVSTPTTANPSIISLTGDTRNVQITDSIVSTLQADPSTKRIMLQNITFGTGTCSNLALNVPAATSSTIAIGSNGVLDTSTNITAVNVGNYCGGQ